MTSRSATPVVRGLIFVATAAVAWGTGGLVAAVLYRDSGLGPIAISFWRTVIGVVLLAAGQLWPSPTRAASVVTPGLTSRGPARRWTVTIVTGAGLAVYQTAYYAAVARSGVAFATVVTLGSAPILIALGARFASGERLGPTGLLALAVAPVGLALVLGDASGAGTAAGALLSLVSASGYALVTVLHRALGGVEPARTTLSGFAVSAVVLAPLAVLEGPWPTRGVAWHTVALLGYLGVFSTAVAYRLFFASLAAVRATTVSVVGLAEPLTAVALAVLLLGEPLTWAMVAGSALLLAAVALLGHAETRHAIATI